MLSVPVHTGTYRYIPVQTGTYRYKQVHTGTYRYKLGRFQGVKQSDEA